MENKAKDMKQTPIQKMLEQIQDNEMLNLSDVKMLLIDLLPYERECIEEPIKIIAPQLCFMLPGDAENLAQDYFTSTYTQ